MRLIARLPFNVLTQNYVLLSTCWSSPQEDSNMFLALGSFDSHLCSAVIYCVFQAKASPFFDFDRG